MNRRLELADDNAAAPASAGDARAPAPDPTRPKKLRYPAIAECVNGEAPGCACNHVECRYHLAHRGYWERHVLPIRDCSLDVANEGPHTLVEVAEILGVSAERVHQVEEQAIEQLKGSSTLRSLLDEFLR